jgi:uncharacterized protein (TIRG00374 family)
MYLTQPVRWFFQSTTLKAQRARSVVKLAFVISLFVILFWLVPIEQVLQALLNADPTLLVVGMLFGFISTALTAVEMRPLAKNQGLQHGVLSILAINLAVKFYNQFLPTSLVGSGIRWYRLSQPGNKIAESLATLAFFRMLETFLMITIGLGFYLLSDQTIFQLSINWLIIMILGIVVAWILITRYSLPMYRWFTSRITPHLPGYVRPFTKRVEKFFTAVSTFADIPALDLLMAVLAGVMSALAGIASGTILAQSLDITISFVEMGWVLALVQLLTQLPFAAAGGLGIREVTIVALLTTLGVNADLALALSLLLLVRGILIAISGGVVEAVWVLRHDRPLLPSNPPINSNSANHIKES